MGGDVPEPERSLLVHERDMTSTLRNFHGSPIKLEVVKSECSDDYLMRMVVLHRDDNGAPVEFGAIGIRLDKFEGPRARTDRQRQRPARRPARKIHH